MSTITTFIMSHLNIIFPLVALIVWGGMQVRKARKNSQVSSNYSRSSDVGNVDEPAFNIDGTYMPSGKKGMDMNGNFYGFGDL